MPENLVDVSTFTDPIAVPVDGDVRNAASVVGCSVGPQLVPVTAVPVQEANVDIRACDGGTITITEFWIDGRSASRQRADTTGNEVESGDIDAGLSVEAEVTE